jgi:hypothetical protein
MNSYMPYKDDWLDICYSTALDSTTVFWLLLVYITQEAGKPDYMQRYYTYWGEISLAAN